MGHFVGEHTAANFGEFDKAIVEVSLKDGGEIFSTSCIRGYKHLDLRVDKKRSEDLQYRT